jgi:hypothetical protein
MSSVETNPFRTHAASSVDMGMLMSYYATTAAAATAATATAAAASLSASAAAASASASASAAASASTTTPASGLGLGVAPGTRPNSDLLPPLSRNISAGAGVAAEMMFPPFDQAERTQSDTFMSIEDDADSFASGGNMSLSNLEFGSHRAPLGSDPNARMESCSNEADGMPSSLSTSAAVSHSTTPGFASPGLIPPSHLADDTFMEYWGATAHAPKQLSTPTNASTTHIRPFPFTPAPPVFDHAAVAAASPALGRTSPTGTTTSTNALDVAVPAAADAPCTPTNAGMCGSGWGVTDTADSVNENEEDADDAMSMRSTNTAKNSTSPKNSSKANTTNSTKHSINGKHALGTTSASNVNANAANGLSTTAPAVKLSSPAFTAYGSGAATTDLSIVKMERQDEELCKTEIHESEMSPSYRKALHRETERLRRKRTVEAFATMRQLLDGRVKKKLQLLLASIDEIQSQRARITELERQNELLVNQLDNRSANPAMEGKHPAAESNTVAPASAFDQCGLIMFVSDANSMQITTANAKFRTVLGYNEKKSFVSWSQICPASELERVQVAIRQVSSGQHPIVHLDRTTITRHNGVSVPVRATFSLVNNKSQTISVVLSPLA